MSIATAGAAAGENAAEIEAAATRRVRAHTTFLADDLLEGRGASTRGHAIAMAYVAAQFARLGIEPAGDRGFQQPLALREARTDLAAGKLVIKDRAGDVALTPLTDTIVRPTTSLAKAEITAPAVFVGFGIHAPEFGYDDFATGVEVRGKIAVVLAGSPAKLPSTARAHYSRERSAEFARRGAVGLITVGTPVEEKRVPWALAANRARFPTMRLVNPDGSLFEDFPELKVTATVSRAAASALFKRASRPIAEVFSASERSEPQAFPLEIEIQLAGAAEVSDVSSANVLGWLPGSDASLADEPVVVTAHLDHLGIGPAVAGDAIYNGALDNALGSAAMLAAAEQLASGQRLRRPVLFAALTAEEKGLLGAYHLAAHPPARVKRYAANINLDMPVILSVARDVIGIGAEHSSLGAALNAAARRVGFTVSPDPAPDEVVFVRSDQYPFVRAGVPALYLKAGVKGLDPKVDPVALEAEFRRTYYHQPSDDLSRSIHWASAGAYARLATDIIRTIAEERVAPAWLANDFFGSRFGRDRMSPAPAGQRK